MPLFRRAEPRESDRRDAVVGRGRKHVYRHNDLGHLEELLCSMDEKRAAVVTDRLFSMDGDFCDLEGLLRLQKRFGFLLVVDEAHSTLVCVDGDYDRTGRTGGAGWPNEDVIRVGTLSKAVRRFPSSSVKIQRRFISLSLSLSSGRADGGLCVLHDRRPGRALQPRPDVRLLDGVERADGRGSSSGDRAGDRTGGREEEGVALAGGACVRGEQPDPPAAGAGRGRAGGGPGAHGGRRGAGGRDQAADCGRVPGADERLLRRGCRAGGGGALVGAVRGAVRSGEAVVIYLLEVVWVGGGDLLEVVELLPDRPSYTFNSSDEMRNTCSLALLLSCSLALLLSCSLALLLSCSLALLLSCSLALLLSCSLALLLSCSLALLLSCSLALLLSCSLALLLSCSLALLLSCSLALLLSCSLALLLSCSLALLLSCSLALLLSCSLALLLSCSLALLLSCSLALLLSCSLALLLSCSLSKGAKPFAKSACYHCTTGPGMDLRGIEPRTSDNLVASSTGVEPRL